MGEAKGRVTHAHFAVLTKKNIQRKRETASNDNNEFQYSTVCL